MTQLLRDRPVPTQDELIARLQEKVGMLMPAFEIEEKAAIAHRINILKREMNAVILGHNYMEPALYHSVPDFVGDSLELARISAETDADVIVFCGVQFMAESAKILNPGKTVLIPSQKAGCSLAAGVTPSDVRALKAMFPGAPVVSYVNTYASVKAETDYCCTSGNAAKVVEHVLAEGHDHIIFLPDEFLAKNTAREVGLPCIVPAMDQPAPPLPDRCIIAWTARCEVHELFTPADIDAVRAQFPDVYIIAHPEVSPEVLEKSDASGSTKQMIAQVRAAEAKQILLLTECSMGDNIAAENPDKEMLRMCSHRCPHMQQITLEDTLAGLEKMQHQVELDPDLIDRARLSIDRMLSIG